MVDNHSLVEQSHEIQLIIGELHQLGCISPDAFIPEGIIAKLPPTWRGFSMALKHGNENMYVKNLLASLDVKEKSQGKDCASKAREAQLSVNIIQHARKRREIQRSYRPPTLGRR